MPTLTVTAPVNEPGAPLLTRQQVWDGLQRLARGDPALFPPGTRTEIVDDIGLEFVRILKLPGAPPVHERVTLLSDKLVVYERVEGGIGLVMTGIETGPDGGYRVRFTLTPAADDARRRVEPAVVAADRDSIAAGPGRLLAALRASDRPSGGSVAQQA